MGRLPRYALWACSLAGTALAAPPAIDDRIRIDQFGYREGGVKVAVIAEPRGGFDAPRPLAPAATLVR